MMTNQTNTRPFANLQELTQFNGVCDLSNTYALIRVSGEDATTFLQGQFSNDVKLVSDELSQLSSYNSPKGRVLALFRLLKHGDDFYIRLPQEILEPTLKRLRMFVLRSKVTLDDVSSDISILGVAGEQGRQLLAEKFSNLPETPESVTHNDGFTIVRTPGVNAQFEILGTSESITALRDSLASKLETVNEHTWHLLNIAAGVPEITEKTVEEFVPQMVNLQLVGGVSFTKGCYPGQEIVARMHYLGKLKKRMYQLQFSGANAPEPNTAIFESGTDNAQAVGNIVYAEALNKDTVLGLAVLQIESAEKQTLHLESQQGTTLNIIDLPYAFDEESTKQKQRM